MDKFSVRKKQLEVATDMLNLNTNWQPDWKFLIYDTIGQNIIAPLLTLDKLKSHNVTEHLSIDKLDREQISGVSAVYFVMPTDKNVDQICKDLTNHLYDSYYLNFISPLPRSKLESIAEAALVSDSAANVKKVYDQYLNFISLEDDLFILREAEKQTVSFNAINRTDATEQDINSVVDRIVDGLFSVLITINVIPYIRCTPGGAAAYISEKLTKKIRESLRDTRNNLFDNKSDSRSAMGYQRPLLALIDRTVDMSTPLHHTWTYQALCHDLLNTELNKVKVIEEQGKPKIYDLDATNDKFWIEQRGNTFPEMAEAVHKGFSEYKRRENEINSLRSGIGLEGGPVDEISGIQDATTKLTNAAKSLPELAEYKRNLAKHTSISTCLLEEIKQRKLDNFFELEEKIMNQSLIDREQLDDMIQNADYGHASDKYRLFLISYICDNPRLTDDEAEKYISSLEALGCSRAAYNYVKRWKTISRINVENLQSSLRSSSGILKTASMFVMEGVKNLVLKEHYLPLTKIVDSLMDANSKASGKQAEKYAFFDPKAPDDRDAAASQRKSFQQALVFVVGGGNYMEYQNLVDYCKSKNRNAQGPMGSRHVIYGSTDLMSATQFLSQLEQMEQ